MIEAQPNPKTVPQCESKLDALTFDDLNEVSLPLNLLPQDLSDTPIQSCSQPASIDQSKFKGSFSRENYSKEGKPGPKFGCGPKVRSKSYVFMPQQIENRASGLDLSTI